MKKNALITCFSLIAFQIAICQNNSQIHEFLDHREKFELTEESEIFQSDFYKVNMVINQDGEFDFQIGEFDKLEFRYTFDEYGFVEEHKRFKSPRSGRNVGLGSRGGKMHYTHSFIYDRDDEGRILKAAQYNENGDEPMNQRNFGYDLNGNLISATFSTKRGNNTQVNFTYDNEGRLIRKLEQKNGEFLQDNTFKYSSMGKTETNVFYFNGKPDRTRVAKYENGKLKEIKILGARDYNTETFKITYGSNGLKTKEFNAFVSENGIENEETIYKYDSNNNLIKKERRKKENEEKERKLVERITYKYDDEGNQIKRKMIRYVNGNVEKSKDIYYSKYDSEGRKIEEISVRNNKPSYAKRYSYEK